MENEQNEYEAERQKSLLENKRKLEELGLLLPQKQESRETSPDSPVLPSRSSKRLKGDTPDIAFIEKGDRITLACLDENSNYTEPIRAVKEPKQPRYKQIDDLFQEYEEQYGNDTILCFGTIENGPDKKLYWSNPNCKFRHPYPVGFKSRKFQFGEYWHQLIGPEGSGPMFEIWNESGLSFQGASPTTAWNDYLDYSRGKHGGTKISGPNFFGFSDTLTQYYIKKLPGYEPFKK